MSEIIAIIQFFIDNKDRIGFASVLLAITFAVVICLFEHKEKLWSRITHRRNKYYFILLVVYAIGISASAYLHYLSAEWLYTLITIFLLYSVLCCLALKPRTQCTHVILRRYKKLLDKGYAVENAKFFDIANHWYLLDADERVEYQLLRGAYYSALGDYMSAYNALCSIRHEYLYREENEYVNMRKSMYISVLGSMTTAQLLLGKPEENTSEDPMTWIVYSYIYENAGNIDAAFEYAKKAKNLLELSKMSKTQKAAIYNDYARYALMHDNESESLRFYQLAFKEAKQSNNAHCLNVSASNLVLRTAIGGDNEKCISILNEYRDSMKGPSIDNMTEYNNCLIEYYRQIGDVNEVYRLIENGYKETSHKLSPEQKEVYKASTFRMIMSGHYKHDWFDGEISRNIEPYMALPLPLRLQVLSEYFGVFMEEEFRSLYRLEPYATLYNNILSYYCSGGLEEIDEYLTTIASYNIKQYCGIVLQKLSIQKHIQGKAHISQSKQQYLDLYKTLLNEGLQLDAANVLMILIDECSSQYNLLLHHPSWREPMYYSDFLDKNPPPAPQESPDGIHLLYPDVIIPPDLDVASVHIDEIQSNVNSLIGLYENWQKHPMKIQLSIGIATTLMCLDRRDEAKAFWDFFKANKLSPEHFKPWYRKYIGMLETEFAQVT